MTSSHQGIRDPLRQLLDQATKSELLAVAMLANLVLWLVILEGAQRVTGTNA